MGTIVKTEPIKSINDIESTRKRLVAKYDVNDPRGVVGDTLVDLSGNGNDGTMKNVEIVEDVSLGRKVMYFNNTPKESPTSYVTFKSSVVPVRHYMKMKLRPAIFGSIMHLFQTLDTSYNSGEYGIGLNIPTATSGGNYGIAYSSYYWKANGSSPGNLIVNPGYNIPSTGLTWVPVDIVNNAITGEKIIVRTFNNLLKESVPSANEVFKGHTRRFTLGCRFDTSLVYGYNGYIDSVEIYDLDAPAIYLICDSKKKLYTIQSGELVTLNITLDSTDAEVKNAIKTKGFTDTTQLINLMKSPSWDMSSFRLVMYDVVG